MKRWSAFLGAVVLLTCALDSLIVWLALKRIDWVVFVADPAGQVVHSHGRPVFSLLGFTVWTCVLAIHAVIVVVIGRTLILRPQGRLGVALVSFLLLLASLTLMAVIHPIFLFYATAAGLPSGIIGALRHLQPLNDVYEHWGLARQAWWIILAQTLLSIGSGLLVRKHTARERGESRESAK